MAGKQDDEDDDGYDSDEELRRDYPEAPEDADFDESAKGIFALLHLFCICAEMSL